MATSKMFVHYSGTIDQFKALSNLSDYNNKIVFIKGGANGEGAAIYTHGEYYGNVKDALAALQQTVGDLKYFTSIKAGDKTASATGKDGIITFNAADPAQVSVDVDAHGVSIGLSKTFTDAVAANTSGLSGEISRATEVEGKIRADLGNNTDAAAADGSAFARIAQLKADLNAMTGGNGSISEQINTAINALDVNESGLDYVKSIKQVDGKIIATVGTFNFDEAGSAAQALTDAKAYVDGKVDGKFDTVGAAAAAEAAAKLYADGLAGNYDASGSAAAAESAAKSHADAEIQKLDATVGSQTVAEGKHVAVEVTEVDGKLTALVVNENDIASAATLAAVKADVDYFLGDALNKENAQAVKDTLKEIQDYINSDVDGAAGMAASIKEAKDAADAAQGEVDALEEVVATKVAQSAYDTKMQELAKADSDNLAEAKAYADGAIKALDVTDSAVAGQYVSAVSEADGKISVTRADLPVYTLATGSANGTVAFNGSDVAVKGLGSAAYTEAAAYATAAQGSNADSALSKANANAEAIQGMVLAEVSGYVTKVSQANGKVSATAVANIPAADIAVADTKALFASENVEAVLAELAEMWAWEEL